MIRSRSPSVSTRELLGPDGYPLMPIEAYMADPYNMVCAPGTLSGERHREEEHPSLPMQSSAKSSQRFFDIALIAPRPLPVLKPPAARAPPLVPSPPSSPHPGPIRCPLWGLSRTLGDWTNTSGMFESVISPWDQSGAWCPRAG